jgi:hypothetical protein
VTLSVADLVYLIRVILGDALPYAKASPVDVGYRISNGVISSESALGAAWMRLSGEVTPTLLANQMEMKYHFDGDCTRVLVYSMDNRTFAGDFLHADAEVLAIELATPDGAPVNARLLPAAFRLGQNYPNPFNPGTTIEFELPSAGEYTLSIYNLSGQLVTEFSGIAEAGVRAVHWEAGDLASGVYLYRLSSGGVSQTRKMLLLK